MIDSVIWAQFINVTHTDTQTNIQTATSPQQMPLQCTASGGKKNQSNKITNTPKTQKEHIELLPDDKHSNLAKM